MYAPSSPLSCAARGKEDISHLHTMIEYAGMANKAREFWLRVKVKEIGNEIHQETNEQERCIDEARIVLSVEVKIAENKVQGSKLREETCTTGRSSRRKRKCSYGKRPCKKVGKKQRGGDTKISMSSHMGNPFY